MRPLTVNLRTILSLFLTMRTPQCLQMVALGLRNFVQLGHRMGIQ
jgi:hypothetical protein